MSMKAELRDKQDAYAKSQGWKPEDAIVMEILTEGKVMKEYGRDEHRWYTMYSQVVRVGDMFIDFQNYSNSGDEPAFDHNEWRDMIFESAVEVFPKTTEIIDYVTADQIK